MPSHSDERTDPRLAVERRRFLKSAAVVAPLVATLPNGAAQAAGSTAQCILDNIQDSQAGAIEPVVSSPPPASDGYSRMTATRVSFRRSLGGFPPQIETVNVYELTAYPGQLFDTNGGVFDPSSFTPAFAEVPGSRTAVSVLALYQPDDPTEPTTVAACIPGTNDPAPTCLYPVTQFAPNDNIGITTSCLVSVTA